MTTSWPVVLVSNSASLRSSAALVAGSRIPASSTTRPVSSGKVSAQAAPATRDSSNPRIARDIVRDHRARRRESMAVAPKRAEASEFHGWWLFQIFRHGERLHGLVAAVERRGPQHTGKGLELGVVGAYRLDVVAPRHRNAVLRTFQLRLQREEILVRLQVRVTLGRDQQPSERAGERALRLLELLKLRGIGDRRSIDLDLTD